VVIYNIPDARETGYFRTSLDHVLTELNLMALRLQSWVKSTRQNESHEDMDKYKGLYISDKEVDDILNGPGFLFSRNSTKQENGITQSEEALLQELSSEIAAGRRGSLDRGINLRLDILQKLFSLSRIEIDTLLLSLLCETDLRYQKLYAYLQDDVTKKAPTISLVSRFLCDSPTKIFRMQEIFTPEAPLIKYHLISLHDDHVSGSASLLTKSIHPDDRITGYLLGQDMIDYRLSHSVYLVNPGHRFQDLILPEDIKKRIQKLILKYKNTPLVCCLSGANGTGQQDIIEGIGSELNVPVMVVNVKNLLFSEIAADTLVPLVFREGALQNAAIFLDGFDSLSSENREISQIYSSITLELSS